MPAAQKKTTQRRTQDGKEFLERVEAAVKTYKAELDRQGSAVISHHATMHQIPITTLWRCVNGVQSIQEFNKKKELLTETEDEMLLSWVLEEAD
jgi:cephalosporin hydroxylase